MGREAKAFYDRAKRCFATNALGELRTTPKGRRYRLKVYNHDLTDPVKDKRAAQQWVDGELAKREEAKRFEGDITYRQLTESYLHDLAKRVGDETLKNSVTRLVQFGRWPNVGDPHRVDMRLARSITRRVIEDFRDAMMVGRSASYVSNGLLSTLRACFRWASSIEAGIYPGLPLPSNPFAGVSMPAVPRRAPRSIDPRKVARFVGWLWRRAYNMGGLHRHHAKSAAILVMTLRDSGARPKELCAAEWDDWHLFDDGWGLIRLAPWKWKNGRKTGEERLIAIPPHCSRYIEAMRAHSDRHPTRIFTHRRAPGRGAGSADVGSAFAGDPWVTIDRERKRVGSTATLQCWFRGVHIEATKAGYGVCEGFRLYFGRSMYATQSRLRSVNDVSLAKAMGTSVRMLDRHYTDLDAAEVLSVARAARSPAA